MESGFRSGSSWEAARSGGPISKSLAERKKGGEGIAASDGVFPEIVKQINSWGKKIAF